MGQYKDKLTKARELESKKNTVYKVEDQSSKKVAEELAEVKNKLDELQNAFERGLDVFDTTTTNELLEKSLDRAVELQKESEGKFDGLVKTIIEQVSKIRPVVNMPEQKREIVNKIVVQDWKKEYVFSDSDKSESTTYVGFVNPGGGWYIERVTKSKTSDKARFIFGKGDYVSNWGKRLQHNYKYLYEAIDAR